MTTSMKELVESARKSVAATEGILQVQLTQLQANEQTVALIRRRHERSEARLRRLAAGDDLRAVLIEEEQQTIGDHDEILEQLDQEIMRATEAVAYLRSELQREKERLAIVERQLPQGDA
jgi:chromosome segregation ATPase